MKLERATIKRGFKRHDTKANLWLKEIINKQGSKVILYADYNYSTPNFYAKLNGEFVDVDKYDIRGDIKYLRSINEKD